jgi:hypothetical protein
MTVTETLHRRAAAPRTRRKAATSDREAAEFVAYPERKADALGVLPPPPPPRGLDRQFAIAAGILALGVVIGAAFSAAPLVRSTALQLRAANVR